jgi:hypothetical protein
LKHAEFLLEEAKKRFSAKDSASGESPPHSPTYCRERPCHRLLCPFLHSHSCACALSHGALLDVATTTPPWHCVLLLSHTRRDSNLCNNHCKLSQRNTDYTPACSIELARPSTELPPV